MLIKNCPVCGKKSSFAFVERRNVPVHQNLLLRSFDQAINTVRGDLHIRICNNCEFCFNNDFDSSRVNYGSDYENTQSYSAYFDKYLDTSVDYLLFEKKLIGKKFIEIGCGKGGFLNKLVSRGGEKTTGVGFDPSYTGPLNTSNDRLIIHKELFGPSSLNGDYDVIICRHVIEHLSDPESLIREIHKSVRNKKNIRIFFETPCVNWILDNDVFWDFFYEHCSLFCADSLRFLFEKNGFEVCDLRHIFNGQYLWLEAKVGSSQGPRIGGKRPSDQAKKYLIRESYLIDAMKKKVADISAIGKIAIWGAGAKGSTLVNIIDPARLYITCLVDVNPLKQGLYNAGSGHKIICPEDLRGLGITHLVLMNPNYQQEVQKLLRTLDFPIKILELA